MASLRILIAAAASSIGLAFALIAALDGHTALRPAVAILETETGRFVASRFTPEERIIG